ncbi:hypothetical protein AHAS_Ahas06G0173100 [Arachis hypogaea]
MCLDLQSHLWKFVLACHAVQLKWHAQVMMALFKLGVPRLRHQVARPRAWTFGLMNWRAMPHVSTGMPVVVDGAGVPFPSWCATPLLWLQALLSGNLY